MKRLTTILLFGLLLHILVSFIFILSPSYLERLRVSKAYKTYLLPGPFFSAEKIVDTYSLSVKWRVNNQWVDGGNPVQEEFNGYHRNLNVSVLYLNRLNRAQFQSLLVEDSVSSIGV